MLSHTDEITKKYVDFQASWQSSGMMGISQPDVCTLHFCQSVKNTFQQNRPRPCLLHSYTYTHGNNNVGEMLD